MPNILPSQYIAGILIFVLFISGGVFMIGSFMDNDPTIVDSSKYQQFNGTFNKLDDVTNTVDNLQDNIENADTDFGIFGVLNSLISTAWNTLKLLFSSLGFMNAVFGGLYSFLGIPFWVGNIIISLVTVMICFAIFGAIFQKDT